MKSKSLLLTIAVLLGLRITATAQTPPSYVPTDGLVGWWPFNGNANDESGNGNDGTVNGAILTDDRYGNVNSAFYFESDGQSINCGNSESLGLTTNSILSLSFWTLSASNKWPFISKYENSNSLNSNYGIGNFNQNFRVTGNGSNSSQFQSNIASGWMNLSIVYNGIMDSVSIYVNGSFIQNDYIVLSADVSSNDLIFGPRFNPSVNSYQPPSGDLDDIGIWNRALTTDEIQALYNGCNVLPTTIAGDLTPFTLATSDYMCNNTPGNTYDWTVTNGVITAGQGTNAITVLWGEEGAGTLSVIETNSEGCSGTPATIDIEIACATTATTLSGPVGPSELTPITYTCDGAAGSTYLWSINNGVISSGQGTNTVTVLWASTGLGSLSVQETTSANCSGDVITLDVVVIPTAVTEESAIGFSLYPNPAQQVLNVAADPSCIGKAYTVHSSTGSVVATGKINSNNSTLSLETMASGNYTLRVEGMQPKLFEVVK